MKNIYLKNIFVLMIIGLLSMMSCSQKDTFTADPYKNFDALWNIMDTRYCYFEEKGVDWDKVGKAYRSQIRPVMTNYELFDLMDKMLRELKDAHVSLKSNFKTSNYRSTILKGYPENLTYYVVDKYQTGTKYSGNVWYNNITYNNHAKDSVGLIVRRSFEGIINVDTLMDIIKRFKSCKALIIDIRGNGGGKMSESSCFASPFTNERTLTGYMNYKTGKGHRDFSRFYAVYVDPAKIIWDKPVVLLTNREVYSAANDFASKMKNFKSVTLLGGRTGGGAGSPSSNRLPNGWRVRFSSIPTYDINKKSIEDGIDPDIFVDLKDEDVKNNIDTLIEEAINFINSM